jgi:hypothetical protein
LLVTTLLRLMLKAIPPLDCLVLAHLFIELPKFTAFFSLPLSLGIPILGHP